MGFAATPDGMLYVFGGMGGEGNRKILGGVMHFNGKIEPALKWSYSGWLAMA
jgi:hypothetical protein